MADETTSTAPPPDELPLVRRTRQLLYRRMKVRALHHPNATPNPGERGATDGGGTKLVQVQTTDGRVFVGRFHCLDPQGNLLLAQTVEHRHTVGADGAPSVEERTLGLVLVPIAHRVSACFEVSLAEAADPDFLDPCQGKGTSPRLVRG